MFVFLPLGKLQCKLTFEILASFFFFQLQSTVKSLTDMRSILTLTHAKNFD